MLETVFDTADRSGDLARHERFAPPRRLVIEKNSIGGVNAVRLTIVHCRPKCGDLGDPVGAARIERRGFTLRRLENLAEHFAAGRLIKTHLLAVLRLKLRNRCQQS